MAVTAKSRARLALEASTNLNPDHALEAVTRSAGQVKGGGTSLLTSGIQNVGAMVQVEAQGPGRVDLSITSGRRIVELCTFSARASNNGGTTLLTVGGLDTYKTTQSTVLGFIPVGPKAIAGIGIYKRFLNAVSSALLAEDPEAAIRIGGPEGA